MSAYSDSMNDLESGTDVATDPTGGPALGGPYTQTSMTTSYDYIYNLATETFGAGALVTGGNNSFTFAQTDTESHNIAATSATNSVSDSGYDTFSQYMQGTETYGSTGAVSAGTDSFTSAQTDSDNLIISQDYGGTTGTTVDVYEITVDDQIYQNFYDVGTDTLGASDSIRAGVDSYTWGQQRDLVSTLTDYGQSVTPYYIGAYSSDQTSLAQTGTDTLTTNGHIYSTVTYTYVEQTSDNSTVSQLETLPYGYYQVTGTASDSYSVSDSGVITIGDTTTTSLDTFTVTDNHTVAGNINSQSESGVNSVGWTDSGHDASNMNAHGTKGTSGDTFSFTEGETGSDNFSLGKTITGTLNGSAQVNASFGTATTGSCAGSSFSYEFAPSTYNSLAEDEPGHRRHRLRPQRGAGQ